MTRFRVLLIALLVQTALSQDISRAAIEGVVLNGSGGSPIPGALVDLTHIENGKVVSRRATTSIDGKFAFRDLPPGSGYQMVVTGEGLRPLAHGQRTSEDPWVPITLAPGQQLTDVRIAVPALTAIRGRVLDRQGNAVAGATVMIMRPVYTRGRRVLQSLTSTVTTVRGEYSRSGLPAGSYYIRVAPRNGDSTAETFLTNPGLLDRSVQGRRFSFSKEPEGYPVVYFPGTSVELAKAINLPEGGTANNTDIRVVKVRTSRVRGAILHHATGKPVTVSRVLLVRKGGALESNWTRSFDSKDGQFDLRGVLPGSYYLTASAPEGDHNLWGRIPVEVAEAEARTIQITVSPAFELKGRIVVEGADGASQPDLSHLSVNLLPDTTTPTDGLLSRVEVEAPSGMSTADRNGVFTLRNLVPWDYRVTIPSSDLRDAYIKSIRLGDKDVLNDGIQLSGALVGQLEIVLGMKAGGLEGRVMDESRQEVALARAVLVPAARHRHDLYAVADASNTGQFQIQGIAPGDYKVFAWHFVPEGAWHDPDFLLRYEDRGIPVRVDEKSTERIEVSVIPRS